MIDWLIVGAGLYGATFARELTDAGQSCLVIDRREYIGGNCADEMICGVRVQRHGGHIFHTNDKSTWEYVNRFADWWHYRHKVKVNYQGRIYSFPINLMTLHQVWGITTPDEARERLQQAGKNGHSLKRWAIAELGEELYYTFIHGYTAKQWGRDPDTLPASIVQRIPIRFTYDDDYFSDTYQGQPVDGYSAMIGEMLRGIPVELGQDFDLSRPNPARHILYTGPLDALFSNEFGTLQYRSLRWEYEQHESDYQGCATMNYTDADVPYTRIIEYRHFMQNPPRNTVIAKEFPMEWHPGREMYYPVNDEPNNRRANLYAAQAKRLGIETGGRLADYRYYDMHQAVAAARKHAERVLNG
ncbi:MAG: UDP-galactopyranose mutase [Desulfurellales bacterium]|nr:MAG: UDP-galactopyranose mutase [Desulfurellales bacterium]